MSKSKGNRGTNTILGNRAHRKSRFRFWEQESGTIYFRGTTNENYDTLRNKANNTQ